MMDPAKNLPWLIVLQVSFLVPPLCLPLLKPKESPAGRLEWLARIQGGERDTVSGEELAIKGDADSCDPHIKGWSAAQDPGGSCWGGRDIFSGNNLSIELALGRQLVGVYGKCLLLQTRRRS
jgi:hypothetical protein